MKVYSTWFKAWQMLSVTNESDLFNELTRARSHLLPGVDASVYAEVKLTFEPSCFSLNFHLASTYYQSYFLFAMLIVCLSHLLFSNFSLFLITSILDFLQYFTAIFTATALLILLTTCLPSSRILAAQDFLLALHWYAIYS